MPYRDVYAYCQTLHPPISRNAIKAKLLELIPEPGIKVIASGLDVSLVLGYYISASNIDSRFVQQAGGRNVIVFARDLDDKWQRFVTVKEMMHMLDDPLETTNSESELEALLADFCGSSETGEMTPQMRSEVQCFWMAIGLLCPEHERVSLQQQRDAEVISDDEISDFLNVPIKYVPAFFHHRYKEIIDRLIR
jgi:hypothetical protein